MHHTRTQQIKEAFRRLSDADPEERRRILRSGAETAPDLWRAAESLLCEMERVPDAFLEPSLELVHAAERARERSRQFLEHGGSISTASVPASAETGIPGQRIGRYELVRPLGEGGFGEVWEAEQREPFHRLVALKLIKRGMDTKQVIGRFEAERRSLAVMDHPNISKVLDAGTTEDGRPFFVMELVIGLPIVEFCRERGLSTASRLRIFELVCRALHHAHRRGIVHRDIKPSNILVSECDDEAMPRVIDFGVAKAMHPDVRPSAQLTQQRQLIGTPAYMAPEQVDARWGEVGAKSDIYSLGVLLYELLTGTTPRDTGDRRGPGGVADELASIVARLEEPIVSGRLPSRLAGVPLELDWITLKCLEVEQARRYDSALALADDVRRFLEDLPVQAGPPDLLYRLRRLCRRHRVLVASAASLIALGLLGGTAGFFWTSAKNLQLRIRNEEYLREKSVAEQARADVERLSDAHLLASLVARAEEDLWPAVPAKIETMQRWLREAEHLVQRRGLHRAELRAVRERALPEGQEGVATRRRSTLERPGYPRLDDSLETETSARSPAQADRDTTTGTWSFESTKDAWHHDMLEDLVQDLDEFCDGTTGTLASVRSRLAFASELRERSLTEHAEAWQATVEAMRQDRAYADLEDGPGFSPQLGLVPLGPDPASGLFEFLDLATHDGPVPERDANGRLRLNDDFGVVLVLIPGGTFLMGAQAEDESAPNFDLFAGTTEGPVHEVRVDPFFLSKFEMTQAQWMRLENGTNPSFLYAGVWVSGQRITRRHPVEQVQWSEGRRVLRKAGMQYPTEAQWEYATRAGTSTAVFYGEEGAQLASLANTADVSARQVTLRISNLDDGHAYSAPVGSFAANPFGLHDVYGNVAEWCSDPFLPNYTSDRPLAEPLSARDLDGSRRRVARGGSYNLLPDHARSARRHAVRGNAILGSIGLRPARAIDRGP